MNKSIIAAILALVLLMPAMVSAYQVALEAKAEKAEVGKGEPFTYTLSIIEEGEPGRPAELVPPDLAGFDVTGTFSSSTMKIIQGKARRVTDQTFRMSSDVPGEHVIPPAKFVMMDPGTGRTETVESNPVKVVVGDKAQGIVKGIAEDIRDIKAPKTFLDKARLFFYGMAAIVVLVFFALLGLAIYLFRGRKSAKPESPATSIQGPKASPRDEAMAALARAERLKDDPKAYYAAVADAIRAYLRDTRGIAAFEATTAEIVAEAERLSIPASSAGLLRLTLDEADLVKFAKYVPTGDEKAAFIGRARRLVSEI
ncbi:MAG: BatD family protein [Nitrospirae bacterium]|nr:BatD family protein [Nitrospirota bacterium]